MSGEKHSQVVNPFLQVALYQPEIPANTGNIARLCGAAELRLHLIHPLGFRVDDRHLRRAGLDYWEAVDIRHHQDLGSLLAAMEAGGRLFSFSRHAKQWYTEAGVQRGDYLLFGQETAGLPAQIRSAFPCYAIPIWGRVRSLNLATSVGIVAYHFLHQLKRF